MTPKADTHGMIVKALGGDIPASVTITRRHAGFEAYSTAFPGIGKGPTITRALADFLKNNLTARQRGEKS